MVLRAFPALRAPWRSLHETRRRWVKVARWASCRGRCRHGGESPTLKTKHSSLGIQASNHEVRAWSLCKNLQVSHLLNSVGGRYCGHSLNQVFPGSLSLGRFAALPLERCFSSMIHAYTPLVRFLIGLAACLGLSLIAMRWVAPLGWMDVPGGRHLHDRCTPRTGGLALLAALGIGQAFGGLQLPLGPGEWAVVYGMGLVGALDDRLDLRARWKALAGLLAAGLLAWLTWGVLRQAGDHLPLFSGHLATKTGLALALLLAWYWSIPQACNLIDGLNGLALGFFLLLALSMDLPLGPHGQGAYLLGALVALAVLNWPRGLQFLGDAGSLALGTLFAMLGVHLLAVESPNRLLWAFAYPIVDVLMVMAIRRSNGRSLGEGDRNHFHHHWLAVLKDRQGAALGLTLLPALACMQVLQGYPGHRFIAWTGFVWLGISAGWFYCRSVPEACRPWPFGKRTGRTPHALPGLERRLEMGERMSATGPSGEQLALIRQEPPVPDPRSR